MSLQRFCQRPIVSVAPDRPIRAACQLLEAHNVGCLLVEEHGQLCGILTDRDIALRVVGHGLDPERTTVGQVMTANPVRIPVHCTLHEVTSLMHRMHIRRLPIIDASGRAVGIVTLDDLFVLLGDELSDLARAVSEAFFRKPAAEGGHWWAASP
jgi:CBS domain-containing protein